MALTATGFALLAKTVWPYYFVEVFIFGTIWAFGRWKVSEKPVRLVSLPLAICVYGLVAEIGSDPDLTQSQMAIEGAAMFVMVGLTAAWIVWHAGGPRAERPGMVAAPAPFQGGWNSKKKPASSRRSGRLGRSRRAAASVPSPPPPGA